MSNLYMGIFTHFLFFLLCIGQDSVGSRSAARLGSRRATTRPPRRSLNSIQFSDLTAVTDTSLWVSGGGQCWYDGNHGAVCDGSEDQVWLCHDARWAGGGYSMNSRCGADKGVTSAEECYNKLVSQYDACSTTFVWLGSACLCISKSATTYETHHDPGTTSYRYDNSYEKVDENSKLCFDHGYPEINPLVHEYRYTVEGCANKCAGDFAVANAMPNPESHRRVSNHNGVLLYDCRCCFDDYYVKDYQGDTFYTYKNRKADSPTLSPTVDPTSSPTLTPTSSPTLNPSNSPSLNPSNSPSLNPSNSPTPVPTSDPTTPTSGIQFSDLTAVTDTSFGVVSGGGQCWYDGNHGAVCDGSEDQVWLCHDARWAGNGYNMNSRCGADKGVTSAEECYNKLVTQYDACSTTFVWLGSACLCFSKSATTYETHQDPGATSYRYDSSPSGVGRRLLGLGSVLSR